MQIAPRTDSRFTSPCSRTPRAITTAVPSVHAAVRIATVAAAAEPSVATLIAAATIVSPTNVRLRHELNDARPTVHSAATSVALASSRSALESQAESGDAAATTNVAAISVRTIE